MSRQHWLGMNPVYLVSPSSLTSFPQYHIQYVPHLCTTQVERRQLYFLEPPIWKKDLSIYKTKNQKSNKSVSYPRNGCIYLEAGIKHNL